MLFTHGRMYQFRVCQQTHDFAEAAGAGKFRNDPIMDSTAAVSQASTQNGFHCRHLFRDTRLQLFERILRFDSQVHHSPGADSQYANNRDIPQGIVDTLIGSAWGIQHRHRIP